MLHTTLPTASSVLRDFDRLGPADQRLVLSALGARWGRRRQAERVEARNRAVASIIDRHRRPTDSLEGWRTITHHLSLVAPELATSTTYRGRAGAAVISPESLRASYRRWLARQTSAA